MSQAIAFLHSFARALAVLAMYPDGHSSRERALDAAYQTLYDLLGVDDRPVFTFLGSEVVYQNRPLREFEDWDWAQRLATIGIQRMEFRESVTRDELEGFLDRASRGLQQHGMDTTEASHLRRDSIRWGSVGLDGADDQQEDISEATISFSVGEEADAIRWVHSEVGEKGSVPLTEAQAIVRSLSVAMHSQSQMIVPLLRLKQFDEYTTTHSMNISVLSMAMGEWLGFGHRDIRALGVAGLLHDVGKVKVPLEVLTKGGKLTEQERLLMNSHPVEGAKIILQSDQRLELAAVIAYEHHIMLNGGGYPRLKYPRDCHYGSKLVHVCDVYDALRTKRPYRDGWPSDKILAYLEERSGVEFDGVLAHQFTRMIRTWEPKPVSEAPAEAA